jgi:Bifunctional DNA primase/polymerase, N-terminal/Primase C terminal 1 (PriCT-1)
MLMNSALKLAARGMAVFPVLPRLKAPATQRGFKDASKDPAIIEKWWQLNSDYNIGIACGEPSKIFVVDIDGGEAETALKALEATHGALPATVEQITARGRHVFFRWPGHPVPCSIGKIAPGIDVKADGGYVLVAPSIHPTGRRYAWSVDGANTFAAAPDWLLALIAAPAHSAPQPIPSLEWRSLAAEIADGRRNCTLTKIAGHLLRRYVDPLLVLELMHALNASKCAPPLPAEDVVRIVDSICGRELKRRSSGRG